MDSPAGALGQLGAQVPSVRLGSLYASVIDFDGAVSFIADYVAAKGPAALVVTPNLVQVAQALSEPVLAEAYGRAVIAPPDGWPVVAAIRLLRRNHGPLERVTGSDLLPTLARRSERVALIGGKPGAAERAAKSLARDTTSLNFLVEPVPPEELEDPEQYSELIARIAAYRPDLVFVGLGLPKRERLALDVCDSLDHGLVLCLGAAIDFAAGVVPRAPVWVQRAGLEWAHRVLKEPRRMFRRYVTSVIPFVLVVAGELWTSRTTGPRRI